MTQISKQNNEIAAQASCGQAVFWLGQAQVFLKTIMHEGQFLFTWPATFQKLDFFLNASHVHQGCIYLIKNTVI